MAPLRPGTRGGDVGLAVGRQRLKQACGLDQASLLPQVRMVPRVVVVRSIGMDLEPLIGKAPPWLGGLKGQPVAPWGGRFRQDGPMARPISSEANLNRIESQAGGNSSGVKLN